MKRLIKIFSLSIAFILLSSVFLVGCNEIKGSSDSTSGGSSSQTPVTYQIIVTPNNTTYGNVYGGGTYAQNEDITIVAIAKDGYEFVKWNDNNVQQARTIIVTSNHTYQAIFRAKTKYYTLDKVEVYLEKYGTTTAKTVRLIDCDIDTASNHEQIGGFGSTDLISADDGRKLLEYNSSTGNYNVLTREDNPFVFYSMHNQYNKFETGTSVDLRLSMTIMCDMFYYDTDHQFVDSAPGQSHGGALVLNLPITTPELNEEMSYTVLAYTDSEHGYKIYAKLNFVEL